jgi:hypothetical protein
MPPLEVWIRGLRTAGPRVHSSVAMLLFSARGPRTSLDDPVQKGMSPKINLPEPRGQGPGCIGVYAAQRWANRSARTADGHVRC